jgi:hypothetical protein
VLLFEAVASIRLHRDDDDDEEEEEEEENNHIVGEE